MNTFKTISGALAIGVSALSLTACGTSVQNSSPAATDDATVSTLSSNHDGRYTIEATGNIYLGDNNDVPDGSANRTAPVLGGYIQPCEPPAALLCGELYSYTSNPKGNVANPVIVISEATLTIGPNGQLAGTGATDATHTFQFTLALNYSAGTFSGQTTGPVFQGFTGPATFSNLKLGPVVPDSFPPAVPPVPGVRYGYAIRPTGVVNFEGSGREGISGFTNIDGGTLAPCDPKSTTQPLCGTIYLDSSYLSDDMADFMSLSNVTVTNNQLTGNISWNWPGIPSPLVTLNADSSGAYSNDVPVYDKYDWDISGLKLTPY